MPEKKTEKQAAFVTLKRCLLRPCRPSRAPAPIRAAAERSPSVAEAELSARRRR